MSAPYSRDERVESPPLELYAWALQAPTGQPEVRFKQLDRKWKLDEVPDAAHVVLGRPPNRSVRPLKTAFGNALRRSLLGLRLRRGVGRHRIVGFQRLNPPPGASGAPGVVRNWLLAGALYRLSTDGSYETVFDKLVQAAGTGGQTTRFHASGDGSIVASFGDVRGHSGVLRAAPTGSPSDPSRIADGLEHLESNEISRVPRVLGRGRVERFSWMMESFLAGREPKIVEGELLDEIVAFCSQLPSGDGPPSAPAEELATIKDLFPQREETLRQIHSQIAPTLERFPRVTRHGDLWRGNLVVERGRLVGVVDWAAWHDSAVPGTDLLHLWVVEKKKGSHGELGEAWRTRPWADPNWLRLTAPYWTALEIEPDAQTLEAVSVAWWATWVAQSIVRHPPRASNPRWVKGNVDAVLESFE